MSKQVVSMLISADWHLGATEPNRFRNELFKTIQTKIKNYKKLDLFVVAGDTFDMKEYFSSDVVKTFLLIMIELLKLTQEYGTQFRFIEGTRTHDAMQLDTLDVIFSKLLECDRIKFIQEVEEEELLGMKILYIPEEYVVDSDLYYKDYLNKKYDFIFGHGMTDLMWYAKNKDIRVEKQTSAPIFKVEDLCKSAGYTYFGHVHYHTLSGPNKRFKYTGPFSRWEHDKDKPCGLYYTEYDIKTRVAIETFVENEWAPILPTIVFQIEKDYTIDEIVTWYTKNVTKRTDYYDRLRIIVVIDTSLNSFLMMRDFILSSYGNIPNIKLVLKLIGTEKNEVENTPTLEESIQEKPYLYDSSMGDEERIAAFIRKKDKVNIPLENILDVILPKDSKIKYREDE